MFIRLSKNNLTLQLVLLIIFSLVLWGKSFVSAGFANGSAWLWWAMALLMSVGVSFMMQKQQISRYPGLQGLLFLCLTVSLTGTEYVSQYWVCLLFLLSFHHILAMYGKDKPYPDIFNAAFFWSAATIFFPDLFFTLPCLLIILLTYAPNDKHAWLSTIVGMGVPYLFLAAFDFLLKQDMLQQNMAQIFVFGLPEVSSLPLLPCVFLLACVVMALLSLFSIQQSAHDTEMTERRRSAAMTTMLIYLLVFHLFSIGHLPTSHLFPFFFPVAFFCAKFVVYLRQDILKEVLFILILAFSVASVYIKSPAWLSCF